MSLYLSALLCKRGYLSSTRFSRALDSVLTNPVMKNFLFLTDVRCGKATFMRLSDAWYTIQNPGPVFMAIIRNIFPYVGNYHQRSQSNFIFIFIIKREKKNHTRNPQPPVHHKALQVKYVFWALIHALRSHTGKTKSVL